jgi:hypothetical protein
MNTHFIQTLASGLFSNPAYLDPGSGSFILQILIASLLGAVFIIRAYWKKITTFFHKGSSAKEEDESEE